MKPAYTSEGCSLHTIQLHLCALPSLLPTPATASPSHPPAEPSGKAFSRPPHSANQAQSHTPHQKTKNHLELKPRMTQFHTECSVWEITCRKSTREDDYRGG